MTRPTLQQVIEEVEKLSPEDKEQLLVYLQEEAEFEARFSIECGGDSWWQGQVNMHTRANTGFA